nr:uncharacterized protein LOC112717547 [Arachis hypogaea]
MKHPPEEYSVLRCDVIDEVVVEMQSKDHNELCYPIIEEKDDQVGEQREIVENESHEHGEKEPQLECHFMVRQGIVLGQVVSNKGISMDPAKVNIITSLSHPSSVREVRSFFTHAEFYRRFIKNFSKIALPLSCLLQKDVDFEFDSACAEAFEELKRALTTASIVRGPDWMQPFKIMYDASNHAVGAAACTARW